MQETWYWFQCGLGDEQKQGKTSDDMEDDCRILAGDCHTVDRSRSGIEEPLVYAESGSLSRFCEVEQC